MTKAFPELEFDKMTTSAIKATDTENWIAVVPFGATEQHGPHLPLETDTIIADGIIGRVKADLPDDLPVTFLPVETVGYSPEHLDYVGTRSLTFDEAINRWTKMGEDLALLGIRKLVLFNAHGGNSPLLNIVATELRCRAGMLCVATGWTRFDRPEGLIRDEDALIDIHGGEIETSIMLALQPDTVDMSKAANFKSAQTGWLEENRYLHAYGRHAFGWKMQDLNPLGVVGNAGAATAEKGEKFLANAASGFVSLLGEVDRFDLDELANMPSI